jgi:hypothetical protein
MPLGWWRRMAFVASPPFGAFGSEVQVGLLQGRLPRRQQHRWLAQQRRGDAEPVLHAKRESPDALGRDGVKTGWSRHLWDAAAPDPVAHCHRQQVVIPCSRPVHGCRVQLRADLAQRPDELPVPAPGNQRGARRRDVEVQDEPHRRCLAGAVRAEEPGYPARPDREARLIDRGNRPNRLVSPSSSIMASRRRAAPAGPGRHGRCSGTKCRRPASGSGR